MVNASDPDTERTNPQSLAFNADADIPRKEDDVTEAGEAPYPLPFSRIVELITTGQPVPGVKEIPDTLLEGQSSSSSHSQRRKPWEVSSAFGTGESPESTHNLV